MASPAKIQKSTICPASPIPILSEYILDEIFSYFQNDSKNLCTFRLVNKSWNQSACRIIKKSLQWKICVKKSFAREKKFVELMSKSGTNLWSAFHLTSEDPFIEPSVYIQKDNKAVNFIQKFSPIITELKIKGMDINFLLKYLSRSVDCLESLQIYDIVNHIGHEDIFTSFIFSKLKSISLLAIRRSGNIQNINCYINILKNSPALSHLELLLHEENLTKVLNEVDLKELSSLKTIRREKGKITNSAIIVEPEHLPTLCPKLTCMSLALRRGDEEMTVEIISSNYAKQLVELELGIDLPQPSGMEQFERPHFVEYNFDPIQNVMLENLNLDGNLAFMENILNDPNFINLQMIQDLLEVFQFQPFAQAFEDFNDLEQMAIHNILAGGQVHGEIVEVHGDVIDFQNNQVAHAEPIPAIENGNAQQNVVVNNAEGQHPEPENAAEEQNQEVPNVVEEQNPIVVANLNEEIQDANPNNENPPVGEEAQNDPQNLQPELNPEDPAPQHPEIFPMGPDLPMEIAEEERPPTPPKKRKLSILGFYPCLKKLSLQNWELENNFNIFLNMPNLQEVDLLVRRSNLPIIFPSSMTSSKVSILKFILVDTLVDDDMIEALASTFPNIIDLTINGVRNDAAFHKICSEMSELRALKISMGYSCISNYLTDEGITGIPNDDLVKMTKYLKDVDDFAEINVEGMRKFPYIGDLKHLQKFSCKGGEMTKFSIYYGFTDCKELTSLNIMVDIGRFGNFHIRRLIDECSALVKLHIYSGSHSAHSGFILDDNDVAYAHSKLPYLDLGNQKCTCKKCPKKFRK